MSDETFSLGRRTFLATSGTAGIAGIAGCGMVEQFDDEDGQGVGQQDASPAADDPEALMVEFYNALVVPQTTYFHSEVTEIELHSVETSLESEGLDASALAERTGLDEETAATIADGETALVETTIDITETGERDTETETWVLATEGGDWRIVGQSHQDPSTGEGSTGEVSDNINVIQSVGQVTAEAGGAVDRVELVVNRTPGAGEIDLTDLSVQYVGDNGFTNLTHATEPGDSYGVEVIAAEQEGDAIITDDADRYQLVVPLGGTRQVDDAVVGPGTAIESELELLEAGQEANVEITTGQGAARTVQLTAPDVLDPEQMDAVEL